MKDLIKKSLLLVLLVFPSWSYALDIDLLKQSIVGTWHPNLKYDNDTPNDEKQLEFYINGDRFMVKYVADYSWVWGNEDAKTINKHGTCAVQVNNDGTLEFNLSRYETGYDKKGNEERKGYGEYSYKLFFVDGLLVGKETWGTRYLKTQPQNNRGIVRFKTIAQAERRGNASSFPFGEDSYTTTVNYYNSDRSNIKKFYKNGNIDEFSNCNPDDYKYGYLIDDWWYFDDGNWSYGYQYFQIKIFARGDNYYVKYFADGKNWQYDVAPLYIDESCGKLTISFKTKQRFWDKCMGYDWNWNYNMEFFINDVGGNRIYGYRIWTDVFGPLDACGIPEPKRCNIMYMNGG